MSEVAIVSGGEKPRISPWAQDLAFLMRLVEIQGRTVVDPLRCYMLYQFALQAVPMTGDVAEIGVYRGGTARLMSRTCGDDKKIHLFDTFAGMPATDGNVDCHREGDFADTSLESVGAFLSDRPNINFHPGLFPLSIPQTVCESVFSLVHIDADIHQSVRAACEFFYPRMERGGIMLFDDYGFVSCPGAKLAVDEFFADRIERPIYLTSGQCFVVRH